MSWWSIGDNVFMGDEPADNVSKGMKDLVEAFGKIPFAEFADVLSTALKCAGVEKILETPLSPWCLRVADRAGNETLFYPSEVRVSPLYMNILCNIFQCYLNNFNRIPTLQEVVAAFSFVLAYRPDTFFSDVPPDGLLYIVCTVGS